MFLTQRDACTSFCAERILHILLRASSRPPRCAAFVLSYKGELTPVISVLQAAIHIYFSLLLITRPLDLYMHETSNMHVIHLPSEELASVSLCRWWRECLEVHVNVHAVSLI